MKKTSSKKTTTKAPAKKTKPVMSNPNEEAIRLKKEADKAKEQQAAAQKQRGVLIVKSAESGRALSRHIAGEGFVDGVSHALGKKWEVTSVGLDIAEGAKITEEDASKALAMLADLNSATGQMQRVSTFAIGDLCLIIKAAFPNTGEDLITNVIREVGREKHTCMQAMRVSEFFPKDKRNERLSFTHHQEAMNYLAKDGKPEGGWSRIEKAFKDAIIEEGPVIEVEGVKSPKRKEAISVAEFRTKLREATGKGGDSNGASKPDTLYYVNSETGEVFKSEGVDTKACKSGDYVVVNASKGFVVGGDGKKFADILPLRQKEEPKAEPKLEVVKPAEPKPAPKVEPKPPVKKVALPV